MLHYLDTCLPCYLTGFPGVVLAVPISGIMTCREAKDGILGDANSADHGIEDWRAFEVAVDEWFAYLDPDAEFAYAETDDEGGTCYVYFGYSPEGER